jgi:hypothetical protein
MMTTTTTWRTATTTSTHASFERVFFSGEQQQEAREHVSRVFSARARSRAHDADDQQKQQRERARVPLLNKINEHMAASEVFLRPATLCGELTGPRRRVFDAAPRGRVPLLCRGARAIYFRAPFIF